MDASQSDPSVGVLKNERQYKEPMGTHSKDRAVEITNMVHIPQDIGEIY